jgi:hypothetical protein
MKKAKQELRSAFPKQCEYLTLTFSCVPSGFRA